MSILHTLRQTARGAAIIKDWLGEGGEPVHQEKADWRAWSCASGNDGSACPHNTAPNWWERAVGAIAEAMRTMLAFKNEVDMHVRQEEHIHVCKLCGCCLRLKVWAPTEHVRKSFSQEAINETPSWCWVRKETIV